jgi:hypothetical protein
MIVMLVPSMSTETKREREAKPTPASGSMARKRG